MVSALPRNHAVDVPGNVNNTLAALTGVRVGHATQALADHELGGTGRRMSPTAGPCLPALAGPGAVGAQGQAVYSRSVRPLPT